MTSPRESWSHPSLGPWSLAGVVNCMERRKAELESHYSQGASEDAFPAEVTLVPPPDVYELLRDKVKTGANRVRNNEPLHCALICTASSLVIFLVLQPPFLCRRRRSSVSGRVIEEHAKDVTALYLLGIFVLTYAILLHYCG